MVKYLPPVGTLKILVRNMRRDGAHRADIVVAMHKRLRLERFDPATLSEADRAKYEELQEFLRDIEQAP